MPRRLTRALIVAAMVLGVACVVVRASDRGSDDLEAKIRQLEREISEMKGTSNGQKSANADAIVELERRLDILTREIEALRLEETAPSSGGEGRHGLAPGASKVYEVRRGVSIGGYGEMLYENPSSRREDGTPSAADARLDFLRAVVYVGYKFSDKIVFNSETEVEHATTGEGGEERGEVALEFAYLDFLIRPALNVRAGLVLVPVGFVNEIHEPPTFLGARRPMVERRIVPATWRENGAGVFGDVGALSYRAFVVSGLSAIAETGAADGFGPDGIRDGRTSGFESPAEDLAVVGRLDWRPLGGVLLGGSLYTGRAGQGATTSDGRPIGARTTIREIHGEARWRGLQARLLWARTTIDDAASINEAQGLTGTASVGERQYGWYGEAGYDLMRLREATKSSLIPFVRYERWDTQDRVPAGFASNPANDASLTTLGVVYKPIPNVAIKLDHAWASNEARTGFDQTSLALGYLF